MLTSLQITRQTRAMGFGKLKEKLCYGGRDEGGDSPRTIAWNTLQTVLTIAKETMDGVPAPGVKAALGGLLAVIDTIEVCHFHSLTPLGRLSHLDRFPPPRLRAAI